MTIADTPRFSLTGRRSRSVDRVPGTAGFDALYRAEFRPLVRIGFAMTGSTAEAEEIVQEAFLRCYQRWGQVATYDRPGAWLRRVVINLAASRGRRVRREVLAVARLGARPAAADTGPPDDGTFWAAVRTLAVRQRQAVVLYYGDDLPVSDVAAIMRCAEGTVRAHLHQARQTLATILEEDAR
ncbi:MAG TPA: SigE family RNA polymerase sigma factor [Acidimicrobiales bacterium]|nr:SigE family RNA polymerase sigma factor [Acidimicrobiales bacterium]